MTTICWPLKMPPTSKAVLIALADHANDQGECWPSIATLAERTCFSERAVQKAIAWLEQHRALIANRSNGRHTRYYITPSQFQPPQEMHSRWSCTPAADSVTPAAGAGGPRSRCATPPHQVPSNHQEPSQTVNKSTRQRVSADKPERPSEVREQTWNDWLALRKAKHAPVTETVLSNAKAEADKAGMTLDRFLEVWCARGSQGLQAEWLKPHERIAPGNSSFRPSAAAANFRGKSYEGTAIDDLPDHLRPTGTYG